MSPYRHPTSKWLLSCLLPLLLWACSSYNPPATLAGISREALLAQMGQPDRERPTDGGSRLEFPRGPYGQHTWFVYLDANGQAIRAEQVLTCLLYTSCILRRICKDLTGQRLTTKSRPISSQLIAVLVARPQQLYFR